MYWEVRQVLESPQPEWQNNGGRDKKTGPFTVAAAAKSTCNQECLKWKQNQALIMAVAQNAAQQRFDHKEINVVF